MSAVGQRLAGKVAIITGAAQGQGAATARLFAAEGARLILTDLSPSGQDLADSLGGAATFVRQDVSEASEWAKTVAAATDAFGRLDVLINNAGVYRPATMQDTDDALWDMHYRVNQKGIFLGMRAAAEAMIASGGGSIVNISSNAGISHVPGIFAYATSKWAVRGMSKLAATELAPLGVRVNVVFPGIIDTPMLGENSAERLQMYREMIPMKRLGSPEEIARLSLFLASDEASYVTGAEITADGGIG